MDMQQRPDEKQKRSYEKPRLRIIELAAEEILSVGCKTNPVSVGKLAPAGCTNPACSTAYGS